MSEVLGSSIDKYREDANTLRQQHSSLRTRLNRLHNLIDTGNSTLFLKTNDTNGFKINNTALLVVDEVPINGDELSTLLAMLIDSNNLLNQFDTMEISRTLVLDANQAMADIEIAKQKTILANETDWRVGLKRALIRSMSVVAITGTLLVMGSISGWELSKLPVVGSLTKSVVAMVVSNASDDVNSPKAIEQSAENQDQSK